MKNQIKIRNPRSKDLAQMKSILEEIELFPSDMLDNMIEPYFNNPSSQHIWLVIEKEEQLLALSYCEPERLTEGTYNLLAIGVRKAFQGQGLGEALVKELEKQLVTRKARVLLVETMGTDEFTLTRKFYPKIGFCEEARIREFYEAGADKVIFWKSLV